MCPRALAPHRGTASCALGPQGQSQDPREADVSSRGGKTHCLPMGCAPWWTVRAATRGRTQTQTPRRESPWRPPALGLCLLGIPYQQGSSENILASQPQHQGHHQAVAHPPQAFILQR